MSKLKLVPPCSYQGGKQRLANKIVDIIFEQNEITENTKFYDLCCGSGAISLEMVNRGFNPISITMVDKSPWGLFWEQIGSGLFSPEVFEYYINDIPSDITKIKEHAQNIAKEPVFEGDLGHSVYKFLILQACAFGSTATWIENNQWKKAGGFRNYWLPTETSNRKSPVNPMMPMPKGLLERVQEIAFEMHHVNGYYCDVNDINIEKGSIVYIDPPYKNTQDYGYSFDYMRFIEKLKDKNSKIYISEGYGFGSETILLSGGRSKGGINGNKTKKSNEEWLNIFQ